MTGVTLTTDSLDGVTLDVVVSDLTEVACLDIFPPPCCVPFSVALAVVGVDVVVFLASSSSVCTTVGFCKARFFSPAARFSVEPPVVVVVDNAVRRSSCPEPVVDGTTGTL